MSDKNNLKDNLNELKKANKEARDFIKKMEKKIAELDIKFAKTLIKDDIDTLRTAKKILHDQNS